MATKQHLQIINPQYSGEECRSFPSFPRLPLELRLEIWHLSLQRPRFITIELNSEAHREIETGNNQWEVTSGASYRVIVLGSKLLSKLLRVSREARDAALRQYRVHLPCRFESGDREADGTLFLNPELDILSIDPVRDPRSIVAFICDLRAYDPLKVGLLNIALDNNAAANLPQVDNGSISPRRRAAFTDILANLRQVYFLCTEIAGRMYLGPLNGISTQIGFEYHRSRPIMPSSPTFERVGRDPRGGMERDLSKVFVGTFDPRQMLYRWRKFLDTWQVQQHCGGPDYRLLVAHGQGLNAISDRESAAGWLQKEEERWTTSRERYAIRVPSKAHTLRKESPEELERVPRPAIGFWLFPLEAMGLMPSEEETVDGYGNGSPWRSKRVLDMRRYWPELCLAHMP